MKCKLVIYAILIAVCACASIAAANTFYDVSLGLWNNTTTSTTWQGLDMAQTGVDGWWFGMMPNSGYWAYTHGDGFDWSQILTYTQFTREYSPNFAADFPRQWQNGGSLPELANADLAGDIRPYYRTPQDPNYRGGWVLGYGMNDLNDTPVIQWKAPASGTASVSFTVTGLHSQYATMGNETHVGLYNAGTQAWTQLGYTTAFSASTDTTGVIAIGSIGTAGTHINAGDSVFVFMGGLSAGTQICSLVSGGINVSPNAPGTIKGTVSNVIGRLAGATVSVDGVGPVTTGTDGTYSISAIEGTHTVTASKAGYVTSTASNVAVTPGQDTVQDFTLQTTSITGTVTSDMTSSNPPVCAAKIIISNNTDVNLTLYTDASGNYFAFLPKADDYEVTVYHNGYNSPVAGVTVANNQLTVKNFNLHFLGTWDVAKDFTTIANPNNEWSYGAIDQSNGNAFTLATSLHTGETYDHMPAPLSEWEIARGHGVWIGKNFGTDQPTWGSNPSWNIPANYYWIEPLDIFLKSGDRDGIATFRWKAPRDGVYDIYCRMFNQCGAAPKQAFSVVKNGNVLGSRLCEGFIGTVNSGQTDSIGPAPAQVFQTTIPINSGDILDFCQDLDYQTGAGWANGYGTNTFPPYTMGVNITIGPGSGTTCTSIAQLKTATLGPVDTTVFLMTPMTVTASVNRFKDHSFYIQSDDRTQAIKLVGDDLTPVIAEGWKITFTGKVVVDPTDSTRKVIQVVSVNYSAQAVAQRPLGASGKSLVGNPDLRDKFVRVWGKVTGTVANTGSDNVNWPYEYYLINDGSATFKVKMHGQATYMTDPTPLGAATVGHYIAVQGILIKDGADYVVFPRGYGSGLNDLDDYWNIDQPHS